MTNERSTGYNSTYPKGGVSCSKDRFVVTRTFVLSINICGESPALRVAAKRWVQCNKKLSLSFVTQTNLTMDTKLFLSRNWGQ
jgi:hypothetical protein